MKFNNTLLLARIHSVYGTVKKFVKALGLTVKQFEHKMNYSKFSIKEINKTCDLLSIEAKDISDYFFCMNS